jgi:uncharacterized protein (DUF4415 family)
MAKSSLLLPPKPIKKLASSPCARLQTMNKPSISELLEDSPPLTQADIDAGRLILRQRQQGRILPLKQRVNIYLDREIIEHFKQRAGGRGYQTLLNETLKQAIQQERLEDTLRRVIREELHGQPLDAQNPAHPRP